MVDFNAEGFISRSFSQIIHSIILEKRYETISSFEKYFRLDSAHKNPPDNIVKASVRAFFMEIRPSFKHWVSEEKYFEVARLCGSDSIEEVEKGFFMIEDELYRRNFIKADTVRLLDLRLVENENRSVDL